MLQISKLRLLSAAAICRLNSPQLEPSSCRFWALVRTRRAKEKKNVRKSEKLSNILQNCKTTKQLKQVHLQFLINNNNNSNYYLLADKLLILLSPDEICLDYTYRVFMDLPSNPSLSSYNNLIRCSIGKSDYIAASAYKRMLNNIISPDRFTLAFLLKSFASFSRLESGQTVHGHVIKLGFVSYTFVMNSLLDFYFKFVRGHLGLGVVRKVFEEMPERDIVSWNTYISGLVYKRLSYEALLAFDDMLLLSACKPDETTLISMVTACTNTTFLEQGKWLDSYIKENKLVLSVPLGNALLTMFVCCDNHVCYAKMVFKSMSKRSTLTWEMMMSGLVVKGFCKETLALFDTMCCCEGGLKPNDGIFSSVLIAFTIDERLVGDGERLFRAIHQMVHGFGVKPNSTHYSFMIRILSDAGWVEAAMMLAESLPWEPDSTDWAHVLRACQLSNGNNLLLDSWIRTISNVNSHQRHFMKCTIKSYMWLVFSRKPNNDVKNAKLMVESLIRKLPDRECIEELNKELEFVVRMNSTPEEGQDNSSVVHSRETLPPHDDEDDVYKAAAESLDRQLLYLHDEMINIIDDPCQLGIYSL